MTPFVLHISEICERFRATALTRQLPLAGIHTVAKGYQHLIPFKTESSRGQPTDLTHVPLIGKTVGSLGPRFQGCSKRNIQLVKLSDHKLNVLTSFFKNQNPLHGLAAFPCQTRPMCQAPANRKYRGIIKNTKAMMPPFILGPWSRADLGR